MSERYWYSRIVFVLIFFSGFLYTQNILANGADQLQLTPAATNDSNRPGLDALKKANADLLNNGSPAISVDQYDPKNLFPQASSSQERAFEGVSRDAMPMTPEQIIRLKEMLSATQRASSASAGTPPKPTLSTQLVSLAPGALPPVVRLQQGFVTSIVFVDETGADWPMESYDLGNARAFNIQWEKGNNVIMVQAINMYTYGNLAIKLQGLSTPVMLTLIPGQKVVDYRVDLRIQKSGPNARAVIVGQTPNAASDILLGVLDGIAPGGSKTLKVTGGNCKAWLSGNKMYLRTELTVLSPAWIGVMTSPDGTNAYEMDKSPTVLVSRYGRPEELKIEGL